MTKTCLTLLIAFAAAAQVPSAVQWEPEPQAFAKGRSPKFLARRAHGVLAVYSAGGNLYYQASNDVGDSFSPPQRINHIEGEVSDHGENSAQLLLAPDDLNLYAIWNARDPKNPQGSFIRFSRAGAMNTSWSPAVTLNDDGLPVSHSFQGAAVAPDGRIFAAWLDGRDKTPGTSSLYLTWSGDGGKTWSKNKKVAAAVCPCCRAAIGFAGQTVVVTYRGVETGDIRDIMAVTSADGVDWTEPALVARDNWKIKGCPHVGASVASVGDRVFVGWYSEGGGKPAIYLAESRDGAKTWLPKKLVSAGTLDPTHPFVAAGEDRVAVIWQGRDAAKGSGWGKMGAFYREVALDGRLGTLQCAAVGKVGVSYPAGSLGMSGRVFLGWTETSAGESTAYLLRGRTKVVVSSRE